MIMKKWTVILVVFCTSLTVLGQGVGGVETDTSVNELDSSEYRDPYLWPFSKKSIWNVPIGKGALYNDASIPAVSKLCPGADEDVIIMTPNEKPFPVFYSDAGWSGLSRCERTGNTLMLDLPIRENFYVESSEATNMAAAILGMDDTTVYQTQPFARCKGNDYATSMVNYPSVDLYGDGIEGAHGGSGLSSLGGTIRLGELVPKGRIRHALKCSVQGAYSLFYSEETKGYRWPASKADDYASEVYGSLGNPVEDCRMGALLALPYWMDIDTLGFQTEPGRILARTCQEFGMYIVDDTDTLDAYKICVERSPDGRVEDEFSLTWGYSFSQENNPDHPWWKDMELLFSLLHVVTNNSIDNVGGGGEALAPEAPEFIQKYSLSVQTDGTAGAEISPNGSVEVFHGTPIQIEVLSVPNSYRFNQWFVSHGEAIIADPDSAKTSAVLKSGDATITASFVSLSTSVREALKLNPNPYAPKIITWSDPVTSILHFHAEGGEVINSIGVFSMQGVQLKSETIHTEKGFLDINSLSEGIYIIKFHLKNGNSISQLFINP